jgi:aspartate aminotransferase-like enzyme
VTDYSRDPAAAALAGAPAASAATSSPAAGKAAGEVSAPSAQCNLSHAISQCQSTDPTVTLSTEATGDTSACTFAWDLIWGDGHGYRHPDGRLHADSFRRHVHAARAVILAALAADGTIAGLCLCHRAGRQLPGAGRWRAGAIYLGA